MGLFDRLFGKKEETEKVLPSVDFGEIHRPFFTVQKGLAQRVPVLFVSQKPLAGRVVRGFFDKLYPRLCRGIFIMCFHLYRGGKGLTASAPAFAGRRR